MIEGFLHLFARRPWLEVGTDILDIVVVAYVIYRALLVVRGTRAIQMATGLAVIFVVFLAAREFRLVTLYNMLSTLLSSIILIVVVVFQNDIRRGLMRVGSRAVMGGISRQQESRVIDEVVAAVTELARHRIGALICFEQDANLDEFVVGQGTTLDASVQRELLVGLFVPESLNKLHDGAVVIRNFRLAKAGVFFPMPESKLLDKSLGSRHRAALGITEETDAVVVIVSEERGTISFCFNGSMVSNLDGASLRQSLLGLFGQRTHARSGKRGQRISSSATRRTHGSGTSIMGGASLGPPTRRSGTADDDDRDDRDDRDAPDSGLERVVTSGRDGMRVSDHALSAASPASPLGPVSGIGGIVSTSGGGTGGAPSSQRSQRSHEARAPLETPLPHPQSVPPPPRGPSEK